MNNSTSAQAHQGPATPTYVLRGHVAPIHALHLFGSNLRLASGDAEGWIVIWDMVTKRPVAVWKAHEGAVLEVKGVRPGDGTATHVYTHGRDHKLRLWRFRAQDEPLLDKTLPADATEASRLETKIQPWLIHSLAVNALNFCAFSMLSLERGKQPLESQPQPSPSDEACQEASPASEPQPEQPSSATSPVLIAVPNALDSGAIDLFHLPLEKRICTIPADSATKTGMVMAVNLFIGPSGTDVYVCSAYEDGQVMVFVRRGPLEPQDLEVAPGNSVAWKWEKLYANKPHSQPVLSIDVSPAKDYFLSSSADAVLVKHPIPAGATSLPSRAPAPPLKTVKTKHAGQQGLRIRSDGKVFATAGWDSRVRVYSGKTMKELAVLKWHKEGCYAVAFARVLTDAASGKSESKVESQGDGGLQLTKREEGEYSLVTVQQQRSQKVQMTHWLAAGSKDGKISLWDIY